MNSIFFVVGALLCGASAFPHFPHFEKETPPQCADPTFACQDLASARLCGVVKTCIHDIWSTMTVPDDNDEVCDICKEMVKEARDQLLSNMTQEEIKEVFEGSCKLLPIKLVADACIKVVDEIIPELVEMLASRMDPTMVCTVSGMCFASHSPADNALLKIIGMILSKDKVTQCTECTTMVTDAQTFLKSTSESQAESYLKSICHEEMPSYLCNLVLNHYFPDIYTYIKNTPALQLCSSAGICPKKCDFTRESKLKDELECEFCEHLLQHVKDLITANTTAEEFKTALLNFCKVIGKFSDKCTALVNDYYDMLFDYIRKLDTKAMCTLMGLCGNNETCSKVVPLVKLIPALEPQRKIPLIKLQPAREIKDNVGPVPLVKLIPASISSKKDIKETNDIFPPQLPLERFDHPFPVFESDTECALCKAFSVYLETDLAGDRSKDGVRTAINGICGKWMVEFPDHCQHITQKYSMKMQYAIVKGTAFEDLCSNVKACPLEEKKPDMIKVTIIEKAGPFCDLCKEAMKEVEDQLSDPATKQKLENFFNQGCNLLPQSLRDDCTSFVNQNVDALIDILEQELQPDNICPALKLCAGAHKITVPQRVKDLECDVCKDVVSSFRQKLQDPASKEIVLTFLEEGCARLPGSLAAECKKFIDEEIDTVMNIIIQEMDPDSVCSLLNICPAALKKKEPKRVKDLECDLCKEVVTEVEDLIKDKKSEDEIKAALDKVCSYLPSSIATKCENFVNQYTDLLIQLLAQELDPDMVCAALNVCPTKDFECVGCQYALHFIQNQLMDSTTQDEVKNVFKKVCSLLPETYEKNCAAFVDEYGSSLLVLLAQEIDPSKMCYALQMCSNTTDISGMLNQVKLNRFKLDECSVCTTVVDYLDKMLEEDDVDKEITKVIERVCNVVPSSFRDKCTTLLETYGPYLLQMIGQLADSKQVCQDIDFCPRSPNSVHLIGGSKCTFGPSYWCRSSAHASACKAEEYCKTKGWKI